ncbi:MAG: NUDIX hydrolase [Leptonema sp. (in: bacteria)]
MKYCCYCGNELLLKIPEGDHLKRYVCSHCETVHYQNPKIIVGTIPVYDNQILLCKRGIEPEYGKWTIPAGFLELEEKVEDGAIRETAEEANAKVEIIKLQAVYSIPKISQVYLLFLAKLIDKNFSPGSETLETELFNINEIPWDELAFSAVRFAIKTFIDDIKINRQTTTHIGFYPDQI